MPHSWGYLAWVIDSTSDQPMLYQWRTWHVSSYRIRLWRCNTYYLKAFSRITSGLISSANFIIPSVMSWVAPGRSCWLGRSLVVRTAEGNKLEVPHTCTLRIDCCVSVSEWSPVQSDMSCYYQRLWMWFKVRCMAGVRGAISAIYRYLVWT